LKKRKERKKKGGEGGEGKGATRAGLNNPSLHNLPKEHAGCKRKESHSTFSMGEKREKKKKEKGYLLAHDLGRMPFLQLTCPSEGRKKKKGRREKI